MKPYYEDDSVTLYQGRCEEVLPQLSLSGSVHLLTDPPYFKVKADDWDNQWSKQAGFLDWMGEWLDLAKPHLSADASVWVFASPQLTSAVERVVGQRFRVLNSIRWAKTGGDNLRRVSLPALRSFVSIWEGIVFAEQNIPEGPLYSAVGAYIAEERRRAGISTGAVNALFPSASGNPAKGVATNWERGYNMPSEEQYARIRALLGPGFLVREYASLVGEYRRVRAEFESLRRPMNITSRDVSTDIWTFDSVAGYPGKHPCEKPSGLLEHMIETTTRPGDTILDCFAGSGAVLDVARQLGRNAVGIEMSAHWCRQAARRLSQQTFDFEGVA